MHRFGKIMVLCEDLGTADSLLGRVRRLAVADGASVTLLVLSDLPRTPAPLDDWAASLREAGLDVTISLEPDAAAALRLALASKADLLVKASTPGQHPLSDLDLHLLHGCACPVWVVTEAAPAQVTGLLAVVDPDPEDATRDALNRLVLRIAAAMAEKSDTRLDVLSVWRLPQEAALRHSLARIRPEEVERIVEAEERQSAWRLDLLMRDFAGFSDRMAVHHRKGVASEIIPHLAVDRGVDTVVMGAIARSDMKGPFAATTLQTILGSVGCSVLTVKPEGFVSPVELET